MIECDVAYCTIAAYTRAVLGWVAAASPEGAAQLLSYTALSIPHAKAFSDGLFGPTADVKQQVTVALQNFSVSCIN